MPDGDVLSQYISDLSNMTKINTSVASRTDNDSNNITGSTLMQFGLINRPAWKRHANRTHISGFTANTERSARTKRHSAVVKDLDTGVISVDNPRNVSEFRTNKLEVSNNKIDFHKIWKNLVSQNIPFSTNKSQPQEKLLLHSADDSSVNDRSAGGSSVDDGSADDSSFVVQKLVKRETEDENIDSESEQCPALEYIVYTWVLCLVALATALKLYYLVKTTLATVMVSVFTTLFLVASIKE
jgi:galactitol-specific phosphotransferase system IIB component